MYELLNSIGERHIKAIAIDLIMSGLGTQNFLKAYPTNWQGWFFSVSPKGKIIRPTSEILEYEHQGLAEFKIYPEDKMLQMFAKWYYKVDDVNKIPSLDRLYFMIIYGYINIDGNWDSYTVRDICVQCNSLVVNDPEISNVSVVIQNRKIISDSYDKKNTDEATIELSEKIAYMKRNVLRKLRMNNLTEQEIPKLLNMLQKTEKQFLDELAEEYERQKERKCREKINDFQQ